MKLLAIWPLLAAVAFAAGYTFGYRAGEMDMLDRTAECDCDLAGFP